MTSAVAIINVRSQKVNLHVEAQAEERNQDKKKLQRIAVPAKKCHKWT